MTQCKQTKLPFSSKFKPEAIKQMIKYQKRAVALALDLAPSQLRKWIRQYEA